MEDQRGGDEPAAVFGHDSNLSISERKRLGVARERRRIRAGHGTERAGVKPASPSGGVVSTRLEQSIHERVVDRAESVGKVGIEPTDRNRPRALGDRAVGVGLAVRNVHADSRFGRAAGAVRGAVEHDAAGLTDEVCEAGRLSADLGGRRGYGHVLLAEAAAERGAEALSPALGLEHPRPRVERRLVAHVLPMAAIELGDPIALRVELEADDLAFHAASVRGRPSNCPLRSSPSSRRIVL